MLCCNIKERSPYLAVILLTIAAFNSNSKKIFSSVTSLNILLYVNIYLVLIFRAELIYTTVTSIFSLLYLLTFIYVTYTIITNSYTSHKILNADKNVELLSVSIHQSAIKRLSSKPDNNRKINRRDLIVVTCITLIYGIIALTNLGSTTIPAESPVLSETANSTIIVDMGENHNISQMKYYSGYCEGDFTLSTSSDGQNYYPLIDSNISHRYADMFRWQIVDITSTARYVKIIKTSGFLELREISFFDENNKIISIQSTQLFKDNKSVLNASYLFDEQQLAPEETTYMSDMYFDEIYHARTAYEYINKIYPYEITHPPFGKSIISLGIRICGMNPFGWRFMGALCGIMMLPIIYVFSKRIFKKTLWASVTCILFALDFMHYTLTRIATIDSFSLFFILLMYLFMYEYTQHNFFNEKLTRTLIPLGLCGISFAFGAATKWICLYAGLGLAIIFFYTIFQRIIEYGVLKDISDNRAALFKKNVILTLVFCVAVFIIIPIAIYCLSYLPYESASKSSFGITGILENQKYMLNYHSYLKTDSPHPYSSSAYSWPFDIRPVYFFASEGLASNMRSVIWCFGNPILWLSAIASIIYIVAKRNDMHLNICGLPFISICALCQFLPNTMITREMFIYHYFTITPFLIIIIVFVLRHLYENYRSGKYIIIVYIVLNCIMFTAFYPVITGIPINYSYAKMLQWFKTWPL